jgi:7,8-dihydropterin-6-yl-methyl-4-(beta-D-ribofuranosyl)aminobenzene 5'-phosphate synthase
MWLAHDPGVAAIAVQEVDGMEELDALRIKILAVDAVGQEHTLLGQHGISVLLEAASGAQRRNILMDVGHNAQALLFNMKELGVDPGCIDAICLSHGHYDHAGGLVEVLQAIGKRQLPVVAHPEIFRPHLSADPFLRSVGVESLSGPTRIAEAGGALLLCRDPLQLMPGLTTTGEVARRTDFEQVDETFKTIEQGRLKADTLPDELSLVARVAGKGLVVITGCSHAGIVNILKACEELAGTDRIEGIVGGLHLWNAPGQRIKKTVQALQETKIGWVAAGHCTGFHAQVELFLAFQDRFKPLSSGMVITVL